MRRVLALAALLQGAAAQYGPDPQGVPADFLCEWRKLALGYATKLRPDAAAVAYDALLVADYCNNTVPRPNEASLPKAFPPHSPSPPAGAVFVDALHGRDSNAGTKDAPLKTVAAGVSKARGTQGRTVVLRAGVHYLSATVELSEADSGLTIQNYGDEEVWVSGGAPLGELKWQAHDVRNGTTQLFPGQNNAKGCTGNDTAARPCGCRKTSTMQQCQSACDSDSSCMSFTWHDAAQGRWAEQCCMWHSEHWAPYSEAGHTSGRKAAPVNVWKADVSHLGLSAVPELRANGERITQARYPNAHPETEFWPTGYLTSKESFVPQGDWLEPKIKPNPNPAKEVMISSPNRSWDAYFANFRGGIGGTCSIYDPPFSFWCQSPPFSQGCGGCFTWNIPGGLRFTKDQLPRAANYTNMQDAQLFAWRKAHWANWMFEIESFDAAKGEMVVGKGGFQGARGGAGSDWFISNVLEELDAAGEFYYDRHAQVMYLFSDGEQGQPPKPSTVLETVNLQVLFNVKGSSMSAPVKGVTFRGIGFKDAAPTFLAPHGVPSGGDWALERFGAVILENTEDARVESCKMWRNSGNGIMISRYNMRPAVVKSEFAWLGGSAVAAWGWTDETSDNGAHGHDGTGGDFPRYTLVEDNLFHEIGIWEKQSSAFFQAKTAQSTVRRNLVFNLARAGFNFNDGFGGGDNISSNVLFNTCRESSDHGPINSWDRQPFLTTVRDGTPSMQMAWREVYGNFLVANYGGSKEVDTDDGSLFWRIHDNYMQYGWSQKFKCGGIESFRNYKAFVDTGGKFDAGCTADSGFPNLWHNDTMIHLGGSDFAYRQCWASETRDWDKTQVQNNTIYLMKDGINAKINACGSKKQTYTLEQFQQAKMGEQGSRQINSYPPTPAIVQSVQQVLAPFF
eukprot:TRINITY_DN11258_c0_g1_i1.p1 TRINITY_DN11258_c0_g1~~TRINITY_DN11258_c0_g1_i1.p1  ORF type:complete len:903 (+),score=355.61 TRINITY_DN11258_c0_g1_i1:80-2788(+)